MKRLKTMHHFLITVPIYLNSPRKDQNGKLHSSLNPMTYGTTLSATNPEDNTMLSEIQINEKQVSYLTAIGSLMYLMLRT